MKYATTEIIVSSIFIILMFAVATVGAYGFLIYPLEALGILCLVLGII